MKYVFTVLVYNTLYILSLYKPDITHLGLKHPISNKLGIEILEDHLLTELHNFHLFRLNPSLICKESIMLRIHDMPVRKELSRRH